MIGHEHGYVRTSCICSRKKQHWSLGCYNRGLLTTLIALATFQGQRVSMKPLRGPGWQRYYHNAASHCSCVLHLWWLSNSPWKGKGVWEGISLSIKGFSLGLIHTSLFPIPWPELACDPTKLQGGWNVWHSYALRRRELMVMNISSVQFSCSVVSNSLRPHEPHHARPPCPSPTPRVHPNPCPLSQWCHPAISFSVVPFSSCPQSFPASGPFPMSQLFTSGGQSIGVSASTSVLPMNIQDWSPLGWTGWISLQSKGLSSLL